MFRAYFHAGKTANTILRPGYLYMAMIDDKFNTYQFQDLL
jgi:hypothetical protein